MTLRICTRCVMDESAPEIEFLASGCSFCQSALERIQLPTWNTPGELASLVQKIRSRARVRGASYDCVIGVSGGVDSTFLLTEAVRLGLRPLAVHMDNCWNSAEASANISAVVTTLSVDLVTRVMPWQAQLEAQRAFLNAHVVDVELLYDNCLQAVLYQVAREMRIPFILGGQNDASEGVEVSQSWVWKKLDRQNIRGILKASGVSRSEIPLISITAWLWFTLVNRITWIDLLNYIPEYSKESALERLTHEYGFIPYHYKHYENVFTRFYQAEILPRKFGIDKRKAHLSSLIVRGEMSRQEALDELAKPAYPTSLRALDRDYVVSKLGWSEDEMEAYLMLPRREHSEYGGDLFLLQIWPFLLKVRRTLVEKKVTRETR